MDAWPGHPLYEAHHVSSRIKPWLNSSRKVVIATQKRNRELGFSLIELLMAMAITLTVFGLAGNLLAGSFNVRARENQKTDALADAQRALNIMTREIANTGFGLANNGIVESDSNASAIRVRSNLNAFDSQTTSNSISDRNEDVKYS